VVNKALCEGFRVVRVRGDHLNGILRDRVGF